MASCSDASHNAASSSGSLSESEAEVQRAKCEAELERKNASVRSGQTAGDINALRAEAESVRHPHWFFKKWRNGSETFTHLSQWDSNTFETYFQNFVRDPTRPRMTYVRTGATGQDLYQVNFCPVPSDLVDLAQLQQQESWTEQEMAKHQQSWSTAMLSRQDPNRPVMFLYTKIRSIKGPASAPSRLLFRRTVDPDSDSELHKTINTFPTCSEKDLETYCAEYGMTREELAASEMASEMLGISALTELYRSKRKHLDSQPEASQPVWLWLHAKGWRVCDAHASGIFEANLCECTSAIGGASEVFYNTGKSLKKLSFTPVPMEHCLNHAARILNAETNSEVVQNSVNHSQTYFLQGDAHWSSSEPTLNWRLVCRVDARSLRNNFRNATRFHMYQKYPRLSSYDIENIWKNHGFPDLSEDRNREHFVLKNTLSVQACHSSSVPQASFQPDVTSPTTHAVMEEQSSSSPIPPQQVSESDNRTSTASSGGASESEIPKPARVSPNLLEEIKSRGGSLRRVSESDNRTPAASSSIGIFEEMNLRRGSLRRVSERHTNTKNPNTMILSAC